MFVPIITLIVFVVLIKRCVLPCCFGRKMNVFLIAFLTFILLKYVFYYVVCGYPFAPNISPVVIALIEWFYIAFMLLLAFVLLRDIGITLCWIRRAFGVHGFAVRRWEFFPTLSPRSARFWAGGLLTLSLLGSGFGMWEAIKVPSFQPVVDIKVERLPEELENFTIVQLSDLHICTLRGAGWLRDVVAKVNKMSPDIVVITGDFVDGTPSDFASLLAPLTGIFAKYGVYGCAGNHEYYSDLRNWLPVFDGFGITMLLNSHQIINVGNSKIVIAGVTDKQAIEYDLEGPNTRMALLGSFNEAPNAPIVLLSHRPQGARANAVAGVSLQLSGHTHGSQMLFFRPLVSLMNQGYVAGLYNVRGMSLYVSRGSGIWMGLAARFGVPSEITCLRLHRR